jgi:hypothetical protein
MKNLSIMLLVVMVSMSSCAKMQEKEMAKESGSPSFQPKPLDDEWSKWLIGKWEVTGGKSDFLGDELEGLGESNEEGAAGFTIELGLNGQFLIMKSWAETGEITDEQMQLLDEQIQHLKETTNASDEDIERSRNSIFKELQIHTIDPKTGERISYFFDSQRCIAKGTGRLEGNKEIMEWRWSGTVHRKKHRKAFQNTNHSTTNCDIVKLCKNSVAPTRKWLYYVRSI